MFSVLSTCPPPPKGGGYILKTARPTWREAEITSQNRAIRISGIVLGAYRRSIAAVAGPSRIVSLFGRFLRISFFSPPRMPGEHLFAQPPLGSKDLGEMLADSLVSRNVVDLRCRQSKIPFAAVWLIVRTTSCRNNPPGRSSSTSSNST